MTRSREDLRNKGEKRRKGREEEERHWREKRGAERKKERDAGERKGKKTKKNTQSALFNPPCPTRNLADLVASTRVMGRDFQNPMGLGWVAEKAKLTQIDPCLALWTTMF